MINFEEALKIALSNAKQLSTEKVDLFNALNRVLAEDVYSDTDIPPFNKSAVDGYACRREDLENELSVIEIIPAGSLPNKRIYKNECSKIMTGAMIPDGVDCVVMVEQTKETGKNKIIFTGEKTHPNIIKQAEDIKKSEIVLKKGIIILPAHVAVMASVGYTNPVVVKQPRIVIIATGDEIIEPAEKQELTKIRNSNAYQLFSQALAINVKPFYLGIIKDDETETETIIDKAINEYDVIIISGGVSMGDFDFIPSILKKKDVNLLFEKIAIKPGKPTVFGIKNNSYVFGLPGNPVSTYILFEMLLKPFLYKMMGYNFSNNTIKLQMAVNYKRRNAERLGFIPVKINTEGKITSVEYHGSAHIHSICNADGIIAMPVGVNELKEGEFVDVRQI